MITLIKWVTFRYLPVPYLPYSYVPVPYFSRNKKSQVDFKNLYIQFFFVKIVHKKGSCRKIGVSGSNPDSILTVKTDPNSTEISFGSTTLGDTIGWYDTVQRTLDFSSNSLLPETLFWLGIHVQLSHKPKDSPPSI